MTKNSISSANFAKGAYRKQLKECLPYGMLATKKWLAGQGFSTHSLDNAVKTETLLPLATGVFCQYSCLLSWEGVVASLQRMVRGDHESIPPVVVGGLSALALSGFGQYLTLSGKPHIHLYAQNQLPAWLRRLSLHMEFEVHRTGRLWPVWLMQDRDFTKEYTWASGLPPVFFSCPERAILELLMDMPDAITFEHADELMQGLVNLSPKKLDVLLKSCKSVKVKRLFFWLGHRQNYPWFKKLNVGDYDLGSGKRVVARGGKLDTNYLVTVPAQMV